MNSLPVLLLLINIPLKSINFPCFPPWGQESYFIAFSVSLDLIKYLRNYKEYVLLSLAALSCLSLCDPMDCSPSGSSLLGDSPRQEYWSGLSCPPPMDLPNPGTEHRSPVLEADSLPFSHQIKMFILLCRGIWINWKYFLYCRYMILSLYFAFFHLPPFGTLKIKPDTLNGNFKLFKFYISHIWHMCLSTRTLSYCLWLSQLQYYQAFCKWDNFNYMVNLNLWDIFNHPLKNRIYSNFTCTP